MEQIFNTLLSRLSSKGLAPQEVPCLIRDVLNIINNGGEFTVRTISEKLENLGWKEQIMDEFIFELILYLLENDGKHEITPQKMH